MPDGNKIVFSWHRITTKIRTYVHCGMLCLSMRFEIVKYSLCVLIVWETHQQIHIYVYTKNVIFNIAQCRPNNNKKPYKDIFDEWRAQRKKHGVGSSRRLQNINDIDLNVVSICQQYSIFNAQNKYIYKWTLKAGLHFTWYI